MRVDKYLKVTRILKRRAVSKELADNQRILINDKIAKPSSTIKVDDFITIILGNKSIKIKVMKLANFTKKEDSDELYELIEEVRLDHINTENV